MSKQSREFFAQVKSGEQIGALEAAREGIQAVAPGLSLSKMLSDVGAELKNQLAHGSHEMSAALFNGSAFVMYPRTKEGVDDPQHDLGAPQQEMERGGREM